MSISVKQLQALLAQTPAGGTFSLADNTLGIEAAQTLFDQYLPNHTLTLTTAQADAAALRVEGSFSLAGYSNLPATVVFATDSAGEQVTGLRLSATLPGWDVQTSFLTFSGAYLQPFGFQSLALVLSAWPDAQQAVVPAYGVGALFPFQGSAGDELITLVALFDATAPAGADYELVASFPAPGLGLNDLNALTQFASKGNFNLIPKDVPVLSELYLNSLRLTADPTSQQLVVASLTVRLGSSWVIIPKLFEFDYVDAVFAATYPTMSPQVSATLVCGMTLPGNVHLKASFYVPSLEMEAELTEPIKLGALLDRYLPNSGLQDFTVSEARFGLTFPTKAYTLSLTIADLWQITDDIAFTELALSVNGTGSGTPVGSLFATLDIAQVALQLEASRLGDSEGWRFGGRTLSGQVVKIGDFIDYLGTKLGITQVPEPIRSLTLSALVVEYTTGTGAFEFTCQGNFSVAGQPVQMVVSIKVASSAAAPTDPDTVVGTKGYSATFSGQLLVNNLTFRVLFNVKNTGAKVFVADYLNADAPTDLHDLVAGISTSAAALVPSGLSISLKEVKFVFLQPAAQTDGQWAFGLGLGAALSLANIPVIGSKLPPNLNLAIDNLQLTYSSAQFSGEQAGTVNALLPAGVRPLPTAGLTPGINFEADVQLGGSTTTLGLPVPAAKPTPPAPTDPHTAPDPVKWVNINKQFGIFQFDRVGVEFQDNVLRFLLDAGISVGPVSFAMQGLSVGSSLSKFEPVFDLSGLALSFVRPSLSVGGAFLKVKEQQQDRTITSFYGEVMVKTSAFGFKAVGGWAPEASPASFFLYANVNAPLGGPPYFFVTGLAAGFGINRTLRLPTMAELPSYLLLPGNAPQPAGSAEQTVASVLPKLQKIFKIQDGQYWMAAGVKFSSFKIIDAFALLTVAFGVDLQIGILGTCAITVPPLAPTPVAYLEIDLLASLTPSSGLLAVEGQLSPASFIYGGFVHLAGGFAFYLWFAGPHQGDFVVSVGGYSPTFSRPAHYPVVPRLALSFGLGPFQVLGQAYFALTPGQLMAGLQLQATWSSGPIKAWFDAGVDFLLAWAPAHYEARAYVMIGASVDVGLFTVHVEVGADLQVWGPDFGGRAHVDLDVVSFTINFGADASPAVPLGWADFKATFLPQNTAAPAKPLMLARMLAAPAAAPPAGSNVLNASVPTGLQQEKVGGYDWVVDPNQFVILTNSTIPANQARWNKADASALALPNTVTSYNQVAANGLYLGLPSSTFDQTTVWNPSLHIGPMGVSDIVSHHDITLHRRAANGQFTEPVNDVRIEPVLLNSTAALWGQQKDDKSANDARLLKCTLVGWRVSPKPSTPGIVNGVPLVQLLFQFGNTTTFDYQQPQPDPAYTVQASSDPANDLLIDIGGQHTAQLANHNYLLGSLVDDWVAQQRTGVLAELAAGGFSTLTSVNVTTMATQKALTDWPLVAMLGQ